MVCMNLHAFYPRSCHSERSEESLPNHKDSNAVAETLRHTCPGGRCQGKAAQGDMVFGFGGLVRVMNKRQEFLWVHEKFAGEY